MTQIENGLKAGNEVINYVLKYLCHRGSFTRTCIRGTTFHLAICTCAVCKVEVIKIQTQTGMNRKTYHILHDDDMV